MNNQIHLPGTAYTLDDLSSTRSDVLDIDDIYVQQKFISEEAQNLESRAQMVQETVKLTRRAEEVGLMPRRASQSGWTILEAFWIDCTTWIRVEAS